jgi:hypothetical protein
MLTGPLSKGARQRRKFTLDIFFKIAKNRKITKFGLFAYGSTKPSLRLCTVVSTTEGAGILLIDFDREIFNKNFKSLILEKTN